MNLNHLNMKINGVKSSKLFQYRNFNKKVTEFCKSY